MQERSEQAMRLPLHPYAHVDPPFRKLEAKTFHPYPLVVRYYGEERHLDHSGFWEHG